MILVFPDMETLSLCLTSGVVPPEVSLQPCIAGFGENGLPWLEPSVKLPRNLPEQLRKLGVQSARSQPSPGEPLDHWLQAIPVVASELPGSVTPNTHVLFELPDPSFLPSIVGEMLRLSNDRQSFRWLSVDGQAGPVLLRVVGPPYYTLMRAIESDPEMAKTGVRAYVEAAPRVWVQMGCTYAMASRVEPPAGHMLLLRPPRKWVQVADAAFRDIYEILDFKLPQGRQLWDAVELKHRLRVPLRLIEGDTPDPELWVLRENAFDQLDTLVRDSKESLIQRLIFAVGANGHKNTIILRVRPSRQAPPQLVLTAEAYSPYMKLQNLFVPVGTRLHPVLRRDALRKLLADDPAQITWLASIADKPGSFTPETMPDDAFRPLQDWVEYVLDHDRKALEAWVQEFRFDFEPFVSMDESTAKPRPPGTGRKRATPAPPAIESKPAPAKPVEPKPQDQFDVVEEVIEVEAIEPSQVQLEIAALEKKFVELPGSLDAAERLEIWPELAKRYALSKAFGDASLCWLNRLWESPDSDRAAQHELLKQWLHAEKTLHVEAFATTFERVLKNDAPAPSDMRTLIVGILGGALQDPPASIISRNLSAIQQYLERHEKTIGVRAAWLAHWALARISKNDALGLARVRDRLLDRLVQDGLSPERDLPNFLRTEGGSNQENLRLFQLRAPTLRQLALEWLAKCKRFQGDDHSFHESTHHLVDLVFAFGYARVAESLASRELLGNALRTVEALPETSDKESKKPVEHYRQLHQILAQAYKFRIDEQLANRPHTGRLPQQLIGMVNRLFPGKGQIDRDTPWYAFERMREQSLILDPEEKNNPYRANRGTTKTEAAISKLPDIADASIARVELGRLLKDGVDGPLTDTDMTTVLGAGLGLSPHLGDEFAIGLLSRSVEYLSGTKFVGVVGIAPERAVELIRLSMFHCARQHRAELMERIVVCCEKLLAESGTQYELFKRKFVADAAGECVRTMRRLGMRDRIAPLLDRMALSALRSRPLKAWHSELNPNVWSEFLRPVLNVASGWMFLGWFERCQETIRFAKNTIFNCTVDALTGVSTLNYVNLVQAYIGALGMGPTNWAIHQFEELLLKLRPFHDLSTLTSYCAWRHLKLIESVVLAVVHEDFALGPNARRWLDEDEYLIRRRIHEDHRRMKKWAGMSD
jgi:hypothetical protein